MNSFKKWFPLVQPLSKYPWKYGPLIMFHMQKIWNHPLWLKLPKCIWTLKFKKWSWIFNLSPKITYPTLFNNFFCSFSYFLSFEVSCFFDFFMLFLQSDFIDWCKRKCLKHASLAFWKPQESNDHYSCFNKSWFY